MSPRVKLGEFTDAEQTAFQRMITKNDEKPKAPEGCYELWPDDIEPCEYESFEALKSGVTAMEIKEVLHLNFADEKGKLFCKKKDKVVKKAPQYDGCWECPYLFGSLQGRGVECLWNDVAAKTEDTVKDIHNPYDEFSRVSKLIDKGILKKG